MGAVLFVLLAFRCIFCAVAKWVLFDTFFTVGKFFVVVLFSFSRRVCGGSSFTNCQLALKLIPVVLECWFPSGQNGRGPFI